MPNAAIARVLQRLRRAGRGAGLDLLQADYVGPRLLQPLQEARQATPDPVDVEACDLYKPIIGRRAMHGQLDP